MSTAHAADSDGTLSQAAKQQLAASGTSTGTPAAPPPQVPLGTKFPVADLMGAVEAIQAHHQHQVEEHRQAKAEAAAAEASGPCPGSTADANSGDGVAGTSEQGGGNGEQDEPPLGYPGTFFLEKPLTAEEAHTLPRMWQPPGGSYPGYPPYPPYGGGPGYPPAPLTGPPGGQQPPYPGRQKHLWHGCRGRHEQAGAPGRLWHLQAAASLFPALPNPRPSPFRPASR